MSYWKIEQFEKLLKLEEDDRADKDATITRGYLKDLRIKISLMKEAFNEGYKAKENFVPQKSVQNGCGKEFKHNTYSWICGEGMKGANLNDIDPLLCDECRNLEKNEQEKKNDI